MRFGRDGFTLVELLVSVVILALISTATVFSLRRTREKEELNTATRLLAGDIRNIQTRALAARNVLTCSLGERKKVCEAENPFPTSWIGPCSPEPPPHFGVSLATGQDVYTLFADIDPSDWRLSDDREILLRRNLNPLGGGTVVISGLKTDIGIPASINLGVGRQNGVVRLDACGDPGLPACDTTEPKILTITLHHQTTNATAEVEVNAVTGRVSIQ